MSREDVVGSSLRGTQKNIDTKSNSARRVAVAADGLQLSAFRVSKDEFGRGRERHTTSMRRAITLVKIIQIQQTSVLSGASEGAQDESCRTAESLTRRRWQLTSTAMLLSEQISPDLLYVV